MPVSPAPRAWHGDPCPWDLWDMLVNHSRVLASQSSALLPGDEEPTPASLCRRTDLPNAPPQKEELLLCVFLTAGLMETGREATPPTTAEDPPLKMMGGWERPPGQHPRPTWGHQLREPGRASSLKKLKAVFNRCLWSII